MLYDLATDGNLSPWDTREWLLTDGTGSFAMGTVAGLATRRYHSMLNAALQPPVGRVNTVARVGEILLIDGQESMHELSCCRFAGGNIHPQGFRHLRSFEVGDQQEFARWTYVVNGIRTVKTLRLVAGSGEAELTYEVSFDSWRSGSTTRITRPSRTSRCRRSR